MSCYLVIGPPGSGKSTQARLLAKELMIPYVEGSRVLAVVSQMENGLGKMVKEKMEKGELVDEALTLMAIESHLQNSWFKKGFVLDGFPRTLWQAKNFKIKPKKVIYVRVSDSVNTERLLKRGRKDDTSAIIKKRLKEYHNQTEPILDYYRKLGVLEEIDGERLIKVIFQDILGRVRK